MNYDMTRSLPGPDNTLHKRFANGITVLIHENPWSSTAALCGSLPCGSCLEVPGKIGLTSFVSAALSAGTRAHDYTRINEYLEGIGASLGFSSGVHRMKFSGNCLAEDLEDLLLLLREILDEPVFPEQYLEILRQRGLAGYELHLNDPEDMSDEKFDELLWGADHPYGRPEFESEEVIRGITREDLIGFHERFFGPKDLILSLTGGFCGPELMDRCGEIFGNWKKAQEDVDFQALFPPVPEPSGTVRSHIEIPEKAETSLVIGTFAPPRNDPAYLSAILGNSILGEFGMMGRLGRVVREERGLAYSVSSSVDSLIAGGCWSAAAGVNPANTEETIRLILSELRRFTTEKVSAQELDDVKASYIGSMPLAFESNAGQASALLSLETYHKDLDHFLRVRERVDAVTAETILETARKWIDPEKTVIVTAGTGK